TAKQRMVLPLPWSSSKSSMGRNSLRYSAALPPTTGVSLRPSPLLKILVRRSILPIPTLLGSGLSTREPTVFYVDSYPRDVPFAIIPMNRFSYLLTRSTPLPENVWATALLRNCLSYSWIVSTPPADSAPYSVQVFNLLLHFSLQFVSTGINDMLPA